MLSWLYKGQPEEGENGFFQRVDVAPLNSARSEPAAVPILRESAEGADMPEKKNADGTTMSAEDAQKDRDDKIDWIGNMTLLTSSLNSSIRNLSVEQKVNGDGRKKGMKAYAELSITKDGIVSRLERGDVVWNEERIVERTDRLSREIEEIWGVLMSPSTMSGWSRSPTVPMKTGKSVRPDVEVEIDSPAKPLAPETGKGTDGENAEVRKGKEAAAAAHAPLTKEKETFSEIESRQYRWQLRQGTKGRCSRCSEELSKRSKRLCDSHLLAERTRMRLRLGYSPEEAKNPKKLKTGRRRKV